MRGEFNGHLKSSVSESGAANETQAQPRLRQAQLAASSDTSKDRHRMHSAVEPLAAAMGKTCVSATHTIRDSRCMREKNREVLIIWLNPKIAGNVLLNIAWLTGKGVRKVIAVFQTGRSGQSQSIATS